MCAPPCANGGVCVNHSECMCTFGYAGPTCTMPGKQSGRDGGELARVCEGRKLTSKLSLQCRIIQFNPLSLMLSCCAACVSDITDCIVPADINRCQNGGTCRLNLLTDTISCECPTAYIGDSCEQSMLK